MNILAISHLFPTELAPYRGIFVARQLSAIAALDATIHVLVPVPWCPPLASAFPYLAARDHRRIRLAPSRGLTAELVPYIRPLVQNHRWAGYSLAKSLDRLKRRRRAWASTEVLYATCLFPDGDAAWRLSHRWGIPAACLAIGSDVNVNANRSSSMRRHFYRVVSGLTENLACGQALKRRVAEVTQRTATSVVGVVDLDEFSPITTDRKWVLRSQRQVKPDECLVLFVGALIKAKGVFELLEAAIALASKYEHLVFCLIGSGQVEQELTRAIEERGLRGSIRLVGAVGGREVASWMQASDVFVLPSYQEGMPNVVMEAMACGLPVVTTRVGGISDELYGCDGVRLIEPRQVQPIVQALEEFIADTALRQSSSKINRRWAQANFGVQANAMRVLQRLQTAIESHRQAAGLAASHVRSDRASREGLLP